MFDALVEMGFKEIEVGFPAASQPDFDFIRQLIEEDLIPDDVTIQVLVQCRPGSDRAHLRVPRRGQEGDRPLLQLDQPAAAPGRVRPRQGGHRRHRRQRRPAVPQARGDDAGSTDIFYEYSPESFTLHRARLRVEICEAVMDVIEPDAGPPADPQPAGDGRDVHAERLRRRDRVVPPHDPQPRLDRPVAAPAQRPRLRGGGGRARRHGRRRPRRGHAVRQRRAHRQRRRRQPGHEPVQPTASTPSSTSPTSTPCAASPSTATACRCTRATRTSATSSTPRSRGSHQDAIKKGFDAIDARPSRLDEYDQWGVPYLPIDPKHVGRTYEAVIRVNSQSGKGGVAYVMKAEHGFDLPRRLQIEFSKTIQDITEDSGTEISPAPCGTPSRREYLPGGAVRSSCAATSCRTEDGGNVTAITAQLVVDGEHRTVIGEGNGPIDAFVHAAARRDLGVDARRGRLRRARHRHGRRRARPSPTSRPSATPANRSRKPTPPTTCAGGSASIPTPRPPRCGRSSRPSTVAADQHIGRARRTIPVHARPLR